MDPAGATALPPGAVRFRADTAYSSLFLGGLGPSALFEMDGELLRAGLKARIGLGHNIELRTEVPVAHTTGGFLDDFLIDFHDFVGASNQGRPGAPRDRFSVRAIQNGATVWTMQEDSFELLDVPTELSWALLPVTEERRYGLAVRGAIEWPYGDEDKGYGNGELDYSVGLTGELRTDVAAVTGHVQHTFVGNPNRAARAGFEFRDVTSVGFGAEIPLVDAAALLLQTEFETSTLRGIRLPRTADPHWLLWSGLRVHLGPRVSMDIAIAEDLAAFISPDFSAYVALTFDVGPAQ